MSYISLLRQRIKTIHTIRKTTSAMRLAAHAIQGRLRKREVVFNTYITSIEQVYAAYQALRTSTATDHVCHKNSALLDAPTRTIILLIGSHKGLCGTFNERLFAFFKRAVTIPPATSFITIGTQASTFMRANQHIPTYTFDQFTSTTLVSIAHQVTQILVNSPATNLIVVSNQSRTFFLQQPHTEELTINFTTCRAEESSAQAKLEFLLARLRLGGKLLKLLYDSLIAEQSARFLSMDNATRNAEDILVQANIDYNKLRQALVTRELLELSSSLDT